MVAGRLRIWFDVLRSYAAGGRMFPQQQDVGMDCGFVDWAGGMDGSNVYL